jgi:N4-gp56 family major capsid protein
MAVLRFADVLNQTPELWSAKLYTQAERRTFWYRHTGPAGSGMPIVRDESLLAEPGDTVHIDIALSLTGAGMSGDTALLEGNEEAAKLRQIDVGVESFQHAVRWGKKPSILNIHNLRTVSLGQLRRWLAGKLDDMIFYEMTGGSFSNFTPTMTEANLPTTMKYFAGSATTAGTVADTDAAGRLKLDDIANVRALARTANQIEPIGMIDGEELYGMVLHDYAALALEKDASWQQAQREAQIRGAGNPLFTGALGMWDGVVLYRSPRVRTAADGASSISVARNIFFGAEACARVWAYTPDWTEQEFSYGQESGVATYMILGHRLISFDLNATATGATTDDTAVGAMVVYSSAVAPTA